ncbi:hypothetical protein EDD29_5600 [Actinocorallia herbida]|uniref:Pyridinium-3,5-bisthiocarboxylic acid mononucleotide nickel insertion protein n=1 Tax=Actinocorallia herbida TaxID=58109 RepID=A0A3N1D350_9ACTN|nr:nickel pincer cofactor biosynthesis protein LarC [Actinocorallia herbida]ROO87951.1 hypothetical protein EDD29_5600 [Actinocorallia herbida]
MSVGRTAWLDATGGISGDMLLGACVDAGLKPAFLEHVVEALRLPEKITIRARETRRAGMRATQVSVGTEDGRHERRLSDLLEILARADLDEETRARSGEVFSALAVAEGRVHGLPADQVHFHEVGALDTLVDVVGTVAGLRELGVDRLYCSPIGLGGGRAATEHGVIPIPGPAVLELLRSAGAPCSGGPVESELATPTGVALAVTLAHSFGPMPVMAPQFTGVGAGGRDHAGHPNVTRLIIGAEPGPQGPAGQHGGGVLLEANVDDQDPRLWPPTLAALLDAGAADAWLTPILMKKGRPAHTLSILCEESRTPAVLRVLFTHTTTIGVRRHVVAKTALAREEVRLSVLGGQVRAKIASLEGEVVNVSVEYEDVVATARTTGLPPKQVLDLARAECADLYPGCPA